MPEIDVCPVEELQPGEVKIVHAGLISLGVYNLEGEYYAIEDRCSHDDGPLAEGPLDVDNCTIECPRHGSLFDLRTGTPKTLPAYEKVDTFAVTVEDDIIKLEIDY
jgi:3-phenylpropionate/trans-cinnamate dioxygenase ferredoxin subunit